MNSLCCAEGATEVDLLRSLLQEGGISPVFQPIVDTATGSVYGYEVLSRGKAPLESPPSFFSVARANNLLWETERACRKKALATIRDSEGASALRFFINVSPGVFTDPRFRDVFTPEALKPYGIAPERVVLEITESIPVADYSELEKVVACFRERGFSIAIDDLGAGHSGLRTLSICAPDFLKLDMALVQGISMDPYKKHVVAFLCSFASAVGGKIIAEGVETWEDMKTLLELGAPLAQGYLFARPAPGFQRPAPFVLERLALLRRAVCKGDCIVGEGLRSLVIRRTTAEKGEMTCEELERIFRKNRTLDHLVVLENEAPVGLVTRQNFFLKTGGTFGYQLYQKHPLEEIATASFLKAPVFSSVSTLAKLAMEREPDELYDPVVVVDDQELFLGTVTMKQIIARAGELEVERAMSCNPLSGLPGNRHIQNWIEEARQGDSFTLVYGDLDRFKEYNDRHGFLKGDELINLTASILREGLEAFPQGSRLGHVGGDDFVCVCPGTVSPLALESICSLFDERKLVFFAPEERTAGYYEAENRRGEKCVVPLVTLSLAVIESDRIAPETHPGKIAEIAASLKHAVKQKTSSEGRSAWMFERRRTDTETMVVENAS
jgi:EAL domain-containing protein (putative c-di-GMP-specific phosphodiesterase class I)/GGDEF domain-containing protein